MTIKNRLRKIEDARRPDSTTRAVIELLKQERRRNGNPQPVPENISKSEATRLLIIEMPS